MIFIIGSPLRQKALHQSGGDLNQHWHQTATGKACPPRQRHAGWLARVRNIWRDKQWLSLMSQHKV